MEGFHTMGTGADGIRSPSSGRSADDRDFLLRLTRSSRAGR
jgi:hypothetical protein